MITLNRTTFAEKNTVGMFVSTLPLCVNVGETDTMLDLCGNITTRHYELFRHQKHPFGEILRTARANGDDVPRLFDVIVSYQNARVEGLPDGTELTWYHNGCSEVPLCLHIEDLGDTGRYKLHFDYQTAVLSDSKTAMLCERLLHIIKQTAEAPAVKVDEIQIVSPDEYQRVIYDFNDTAVAFPQDKLIHQLFEEQVEKKANSPAVVACDKTLSYAELNNDSNKIDLS